MVPDKATRVRNIHELTVEALAELVGAAGLESPSQITTEHITVRNVSGVAVSLASTLPAIEAGALLDEAKIELLPEPFRSHWTSANADTFERRARPR